MCERPKEERRKNTGKPMNNDNTQNKDTRGQDLLVDVRILFSYLVSICVGGWGMGGGGGGGFFNKTSPRLQNVKKL